MMIALRPRGGSPRRIRAQQNAVQFAVESLERRLLLAVGTNTASTRAADVLNTSPAVFVENDGQWADPTVRFIQQGKGANIALTDTGATFQLFREDSTK